MKSLKTHNSRITPLILSLAFTNFAFAQGMDTKDLEPTHTRTLSCGQVDMAWNLELIEQYPRIPDACFEVINNNGNKWARFEADFIRLDRDGSVVADFVSPGGRSMGRYTVLNNPGQQVTLDGRKYPFTALRGGQRINLYVPEGAAALTTEVGTPPESYGRIVRYEAPAEPPQLAQAAPVLSPSALRLPNTAGVLPWFAVLGIGALLIGAGLRFANRT